MATCAEEKDGPDESARAGRNGDLQELFLACVGEEFVRTDHLTVQRARD